MNSTSLPLGVLMTDVEGLELTSEDRDLLSNPHVGGVILGLFGRNYSSLTQLQDLIAAIRQCNSQLLIAVDQEGGRVQRFKQDFSRLPPMRRFGEMYELEPERALEVTQTCGWLMAAEVLAVGLDISFAPVLDLFMETSKVIADRAFAAEPETVTSLATAFIDGMHQAGMKATGKHYPGHGSVEADSHIELPVDPRVLEQIADSDLKPFADCADQLDAIMPGHVLYPEVDDQCAAMSKTWLQEICRQQLGFTGVIFSDDLSMAAATGAGKIQQRAESALRAGCDMILVCNNRQHTITTLDWLESSNYPQSEKLASMQGSRQHNLNELKQTNLWQQANATIEALVSEQE